MIFRGNRADFCLETALPALIFVWRAVQFFKIGTLFQFQIGNVQRAGFFFAFPENLQFDFRIFRRIAIMDSFSGCSLVFEQSYGEIDGDSASSTELYVITRLEAFVDLMRRKKRKAVIENKKTAEKAKPLQ